MLEKGKISPSQFFILIMMYVIGTSILYVPFLVTAVAKQDAWLSILFGLSTGLFLTLIYSALAKRYPEFTLIEMNERILGKWAGKGLSLLFFIYFFTLSAGLLRILGDFITTHIMPETPIQAIEIIYMIIVIYGVRLGLETFSRTSEMVLPWILLFFFLLVFFLLPQIHLFKLFPIMERGLKPVIRGGFLSLGVPFSDIVIFLMIAPYVSQRDKIGRILFLSTLLGGVIIFVIVIMSLLVLGPTQTAHMNYPIYILAQKVDIGNFIQRIEVLAGGMVFISIFIKSTICFYSLALSSAQILNLKDMKILTFPFAILIIFFANIMSPNLVYFHTFLFTAWTPLVLIFGLLFPIILLGVDTIKTGIKRRNNKLSGSG